jgi:hypothetical protein
LRNVGRTNTVTVQYHPSLRRWSLTDPNGRTKMLQRLSFGLSRVWEWDDQVPPSPQSIEYKVGYRAGMRPAIGPVIGILASEHGSRFRGNSKNFLDILEMGKQLGALVYVFTPNGWDENSGKVQGFTYQPLTKKWVEGYFPLPNVVYNRIPYREDEEIPKIKQLLHHLRNHPEVKMFNPAFFNKGELFYWLRDDRSVMAYLPVTHKLKDRLDLEKMVKEFPVVYLKPTDGMAGSGIMRIDVISAGRYKLTKQQDRRSDSRTFSSLVEVWNHLGSTITTHPYLIQQGIRLSRYKGRSFDIRALLQKDVSGQWRITGIGARVAGKESITTHVPRGGEVGRPYDLLKADHGSKALHIMQNVEKAALQLAQAIENRGIRPLGEISMDLAVDQGGAPWFLEANAKPMKFDEPQIRKKSLERIIEYSYYLAGYADKR